MFYENEKQETTEIDTPEYFCVIYVLGRLVSVTIDVRTLGGAVIRDRGAWIPYHKTIVVFTVKPALTQTGPAFPRTFLHPKVSFVPATSSPTVRGGGSIQGVGKKVVGVRSRMGRATWSLCLLLLVAMTGVTTANSTEGHCRRSCRCFVDSDGFRSANCSTSAFHPHAGHQKSDHSVVSLYVHHNQRQYAFKLFPSMFKSFKSVKYLDLSNCSIGSLPNDVFAGLVYITEIDLSFNNIKHLNGAVFSSLRNLQCLRVRGNPLYISPWNAIVSKSLTELDMGYCSLQNVPADTFLKVGRVTRLYLDGNKLNTIGHIFPSGLSHLNLARNNIVNVPVEVLHSMTHLKTLDLSDNPINCTCHLLLLQDFYSGRGIAFTNEVACAYPPQYAGRRVSRINEDELCKDELFTKEGHINNIGYTSVYNLEASKKHGRHNMVYEPSVMADQPAPTDEETFLGDTEGFTYVDSKSEKEEDQEGENYEDETGDPTEYVSKASETAPPVEPEETDYSDSSMRFSDEVANSTANEPQNTTNFSTTNHDDSTTYSEHESPSDSTSDVGVSRPTPLAATVVSDASSEQETTSTSDETPSFHPEDIVEFTDLNNTLISRTAESLIQETPSYATNTSTESTEYTEEWSGDGESSLETGVTSSEDVSGETAMMNSTATESTEFLGSGAPDNSTEEGDTSGSPSETGEVTDSETTPTAEEILTTTPADITSSDNETESAVWTSSSNSTEDDSDFEFSAESTSETQPSSSDSTTTPETFNSEDISSATTEEDTETTTEEDDATTDSFTELTTEYFDHGLSSDSETSTTEESTDSVVLSSFSSTNLTEASSEEPSTTIENTTPLVTAEETTPLVTEEETTPKVTEEETTPIVTEDETTPIVTEDETTPAVSQEETTPAVIQEETSPIVTEEETSPIVTQEDTSPIVIQKENTTESTYIGEQETTNIPPSRVSAECVTGEETSSTAAPPFVPAVQEKVTTTSTEVAADDTTEAEVLAATVAEVGSSPTGGAFGNEEYRGTSVAKEEKGPAIGSYIVVGLIALLVLGLIVLAVFKSRRRRSGSPSKVRLPSDLESNPGTEMRDMDSLLPKPPENGVVKIVPRDYGEQQKPVNGDVKEETQPLSRHEDKDQLEGQPPSGQGEETEERPEQNGTVQKATARLTHLPEPKLQTPVFIHKPHPDE
ncbi:hypothetical protein AAG570_002330 [Ranatra chinensis]|uniref:Uncharacterized protein n=1 Tax=Ranatra chinensis TaxID=642074 RepID=A0ABD0Y780_9HEMI